MNEALMQPVLLERIQRFQRRVGQLGTVDGAAGMARRLDEALSRLEADDPGVPMVRLLLLGGTGVGKSRLFNTLIADNVARMEKYGILDCNMEDHAEIIATSYSWIADGNCEAAFSGDPLLGPLADNGGPTLTHGLLPGSPAIDAIPAESCRLETDQRGEPRLAPCDIGAFEVQAD